MKIDITMLIVAGVLTSCGVYLLLEKALTRILLGFLLLGNALNILLIDLAGPAGVPSFFGFFVHQKISDPLAQAMVLTSIVISMASAAFIIALAYRSFMIIETEDISHVSREPLESLDDTVGAKDLVEDDDHYRPAEDPAVDRAYSDEFDEPTGDLFEPLNIPEEWDDNSDSPTESAPRKEPAENSAHHSLDNQKIQEDPPLNYTEKLPIKSLRMPKKDSSSSKDLKKKKDDKRD